MALLNKTRLVGAAALLVATAAHAAPVRVCAMTPSQTAALDAAVAKLVFARMDQPTTQVELASADDPNPANNPFKIARLLNTRCDVMVGVPLSEQGDKPKHTLAAAYLDASFVRFSLQAARLASDASGQYAVAYSSPGQLMMAETGEKNFQVVNTQDQVIDDVVHGKTQYGIAWRPSLIGYQAEHADVHFALEPMHSVIANWQVSFVADASRGALIERIRATLAGLRKSGQLAKLSAAKLRVPFKSAAGADGDVD